jgi:hypothetical protein
VRHHPNLNDAREKASRHAIVLGAPNLLFYLIDLCSAHSEHKWLHYLTQAMRLGAYFDYFNAHIHPSFMNMAMDPS